MIQQLQRHWENKRLPIVLHTTRPCRIICGKGGHYQKMTKCCEFCGSPIFRASSATRYCSGECRSAARFIKRLKEAAEQEGQRRAATVWRERQLKHLQKSVCLYCLKMTWTQQETEFCCEACRTIFYSGNTVEVRKTNAHD